MKKLIASTACAWALLTLLPLQAVPNLLSSFDFETGGDAQGWAGVNAALSFADGVLSGSVTAPDPQVVQAGLNFSGSASSGVLLRYQGSTAGNVQLFWGRSGADNYSGTRVITAGYSGSGDWETLYFDSSAHPDWAGKTVTRLRIDPAGSTGADFDFAWIRILAWDYDGDGWRDSVEGIADSDGDGLLDLEDPDSNNDNLSDAWEKAISNAPGSVHFNFDASDGGWAATGGLSVTGFSDGLLQAEVTGADPQLARGRLHLWAGMIRGVHVRINTPQAGSLTLYWSHDRSDNFDDSRKLTLAVPSSGGLDQTLRFDMTAAPEWNGEMITGLRMDTDFPTGSTFSIDWIRTSDGDYDRDRISDTDEGSGDIDGDGLANFEDPDSDGDGISDAQEASLGWDVYAANEATSDRDKDGFSDAAEIQAGTDPQNPEDFPSAQIAVDATSVALSTPGRDGRRYRLRSSENLSSWSDGTWSSELSGSTNPLWEFERTKDKEFYQIQIESPIQHPMLVGNPVVEIGNHEVPALDNGTLRLQAPTSQGASFDYLAPYVNGSLGGNLVNWHDQGRLIQQSYYAGAGLDRTADGQATRWSPWAWNPIQGGDAALNVAPVVEAGITDFGTGFYSRTIPLLWDMTTGEQGKCWMDQWNEFESGMDDVVRVTCRLIVFRDADDIWGGPVLRSQEMPAVYLIRSLSKVVSYLGDNPWTNELAEVLDYSPDPAKAPFPWAQFTPTEMWVAMVDPATDVGVGLFSPIGDFRWNVGAVGSPPGGPTDGQTMHMAPIRRMSLDRDSIMVYRYWIIYGDLATVRERVYQLRQKYPGG